MALAKNAKLNYAEQELMLYAPEFVSNDHKSGRKVLTVLENELLRCDFFCISVAFITDGGIKPLLQTLRLLEEKEIAGRIMTTNYLSFSEPKALKKLASIKNIELKMYDVEYRDHGFHPKGYMFRRINDNNSEDYTIIIGSSNMTASALTLNKEWNVKITSGVHAQYTQDILSEFNDLWAQAKPLDEWLDRYTEIYEEQKRIARAQEVPRLEQYRLKPNAMQVSFVNSLMKIIDSGENKALLISATGTGKTYASAFALREFKPDKALFVVHREQIAKQAMQAYSVVFGDTKSIALLSGTSKEYEADILFATMQTLSKDETLTRFDPGAFQFVVIDEVHRAGAESYQ